MSVHDSEGCGLDTAAYALGALQEREVPAFERHLETCTVCRDELAAFTQVAGSLAISPPQLSASRRLRRRVLAEVRAERKRETSRETSRDARPGGARVSMRPRGWALGALASLAVALAVGAGIELSGSSGLHTRVTSAQVSAPSAAELHVRGGHAELIVRDLPQPPAGQIYEVWLQRGSGHPIPTSALFDVTASGDGDVAIPGNVNHYSRMMVTAEQAGGSAVPHGTPVIVAPLTSQST